MGTHYCHRQVFICMYASRYSWLTDTTRKFSIVDMVVLNVKSCILSVEEVDEKAHQGYTLACMYVS